MVALAADHQSIHVRRWMISTAIVVLAHAAIVSAVLTWRKVIAPSTFQGPIEINLTPEPVSPATPQAAPPRPLTPPATSARPPAQPSQPREGTPASGDLATLAPGPREQRPAVTGPIIVTPEDRARQEFDALHGKESPGTGQTGRMGGPIDTELAKPATPLDQRGLTDWRRALLARPGAKSGLAPYLNLPMSSTALANPDLSVNPTAPGTLSVLPKLGPSTNLGGRSLRHGPRLPLNSTSPARNSIGALERVGPVVGPGLSRDALGTLRPGGTAGLTAPNVLSGTRTTTNAIGTRIELPPNTTGPNSARYGATGLRQSSGPFASRSPALGLNGTALARPGSTIGILGGAAKNTGGLNGTGFGPR